MLTFIQFVDNLFEELNTRQKNIADKFPEHTPLVKEQQPHFLNGKEIHHIDVDENHVPKKIHDVLKAKGIDVTDYKNGKGKDKHGREVKLGKHIINSPDLSIHDKKDYESTQRERGKLGIKLDSTRYGIAGMSAEGHTPWESCMTLGTCGYENNDGANSHYLKHEHKHGTIVAYLHNKEKDPNANNPTARIAVKPHIDDNGNLKYFPESRTYGAKHEGLRKSVEEHFKDKNGGDWIYAKKHPEVYSDDGTDTKYNKNLSHKQIEDSIKSDDVEKHYAVLHQPHLSEKHFEDIMNHSKFSKEHSRLIKDHPSATENTIRKLYKHYPTTAVQSEKIPKDLLEHAYKNDDIKHLAIKHPNFPEHLREKILNGDDDEEKEFLANNRTLSHDHINKLLDKNDKNINNGLVYNDKLTPEHLKRIYDNSNSRYVKGVVAEHENASPVLLHHILDDKDADDIVKSRGLENPNANSSHIDKAIATKNSGLVRSALKSKHITPHHIDKIIDHYKDENFNLPSGYVINHSAVNKNNIKHALEVGEKHNSDIARYAADSKLMTPEMIDKALDSKHGHVRFYAARNHNASSENLHKAIKDSDLNVAQAAIENKNAKPEHRAAYNDRLYSELFDK